MSPSTRRTVKEELAALKAEVDNRPKMLSIPGAMDYSGLSDDRLRRLVKADQIAAVRADGNGKLLIVRESLDLYLDSLPSA